MVLNHDEARVLYNSPRAKVEVGGGGNDYVKALHCRRRDAYRPIMWFFWLKLRSPEVNIVARFFLLWPAYTTVSRFFFSPRWWPSTEVLLELYIDIDLVVIFFFYLEICRLRGWRTSPGTSTGPRFCTTYICTRLDSMAWCYSSPKPNGWPYFLVRVIINFNLHIIFHSPVVLSRYKIFH